MTPSRGDRWGESWRVFRAPARPTARIELGPAKSREDRSATSLLPVVPRFARGGTRGRVPSGLGNAGMHVPPGGLCGLLGNPFPRTRVWSLRVVCPVEGQHCCRNLNFLQSQVGRFVRRNVAQIISYSPAITYGQDPDGARPLRTFGSDLCILRAASTPRQSASCPPGTDDNRRQNCYTPARWILPLGVLRHELTREAD